MPAPEPKPIRVFYSYAHKDELFREELEKHLAILRRQGVIEQWHDRKIIAGQHWAASIDQNLELADVVLLLISPDFLSSNYCYETEMKRALEREQTRKARVIPIIVRSVDWKGAPFAHLQALPKDAKAVDSWPKPDEAWTDVAKGIRLAVGDLRKIVLPRKDEPCKISQPDAGRGSRRRVAAKTRPHLISVMLADDHRVLCKALKLLLEQNGCEVVGEAATGEEALVVAATVHLQVIVMDLKCRGLVVSPSLIAL